MFSFSPGQGLVEYTYDISWNYGWNLCEKKEEVILGEKMGKVAKGKKKKKKKKVFLYVLKILY